MDQKIPVTILTGFLGAGKTTLLNRLIAQNPDKRLGIIENEFGEINIDSELVIGVEDGLFELSNGCICCELNDDLKEILFKLKNSDKKIDHLIVETTGIADPAPVAMSFLSDPEIQQMFRLDAIVVLADAQFIEMQLENHDEACKQVATADIVLINKIDKVDPYLIDTAKNIIKKINPIAEILQSSYGEVSGISLLEINAFNKEKILKTKFEIGFDKAKHQIFSPVGEPVKPVSLLNHNNVKVPRHSDIKSISFIFPEALDPLKFNIWIRSVVNRAVIPLYRVKGILNFYGSDQKVILQVVNNQSITETAGLWVEGEERLSKIVLIGKNLDSDDLEKELKLCVYNEELSMEVFYQKIFDQLQETEQKVLKSL